MEEARPQNGTHHEHDAGRALLDLPQGALTSWRDLSPLELAIVHDAALGMTPYESGRRHNYAEATVRTKRSRIITKVGCRRFREVVTMYAVDWIRKVANDGSELRTTR